MNVLYSNTNRVEYFHELDLLPCEAETPTKFGNVFINSLHHLQFCPLQALSFKAIFNPVVWDLYFLFVFIYIWLQCVTYHNLGEGRKRSQLSHPATSEYALGGSNVDLAGMVGTIKTPSGGSEPCLLRKMPDGSLGEYILYSFHSAFCLSNHLLSLATISSNVAARRCHYFGVA